MLVVICISFSLSVVCNNIYYCMNMFSKFLSVPKFVL